MSPQPFDKDKYERLLSGLECSEVRLSYVKAISDVFRLDSFFYAQRFLQDEQQIIKTKGKTLGELGARLRSFGAYSLNNFVDYLPEGVPFIRGVNMKNGFIETTDMLHISKDANKLLWKSEVSPWDVLVSMSGSIGDVAIALPDWPYPINSNQDIAKIHFKSNVNPVYAYTFFLSKFGQNYLLREARGSVQQHVFLSQMENFVLPGLSEAFQNKISDVVLSAHAQYMAHNKSYEAAEKLLLSSLGIDKDKCNKENITVKSFSSSFAISGRLDAEYYQPKYDSYFKTIKDYKNGYVFIGNKFKKVNKKPTYQKKSYYYTEIGNVSTADGSLVWKELLTKELPANAKIIVQEHDLLVSKVRPNRGAVSIVPVIPEKPLIVSGAFCVLRQISDFPIDTLAVLLRTPLYKDWLLKYNVGTSYPVIKDEDVLNMPLPLLEQDVHGAVTEAVQRSSAERTKAKKLLHTATRAVEIAIEQGEAAALVYLSDMQ